MEKILLFVIDAQNDFMTSGSLAVPNGDKIIPTINYYIKDKRTIEVIFSRDMHSLNHTSFAINHNVEPFTIINGEVKWPVHCVAMEHGSQIHNDILSSHHLNTRQIWKGMNKDEEEYSAVTEKALKYIGESQANVIIVCGLATDYCVLHTVRDLVKKVNKKIKLDLDGCRGVNEKTTLEAIEEMKSLGVEII